MENRIPVPTDNLFKFCALFGLLLAAFSLGSTIYVTKSTNELVYSSMVEFEELKQLQTPSISEATKLKGLERRLEIARSDKKFFQDNLAYLLAGSLVLVVFGFWKWYFDLQPMQDRLLRLQAEKLQLEINDYRRIRPRR